MSGPEVWKTKRYRGKCIYCLREIYKHNPDPQLQPSREHVISQSLHSELVIKCVCKECNNRFSDHFENVALTDSGLGLEAIRYFDKAVDPGNKLQHIQLILFYDEKWGVFQGLRLGLLFDQKSQSNRLINLPQIGFEFVSGKYQYFTKQDLLSSTTRDRFKALTKNTCIMLGSQSDQNDLQNWIKNTGLLRYENRHNPPLYPEAILDHGTNAVRTLATFDPLLSELKRLLTKYALNFLAYIRGPEFVLKSEFNSARNYVLNGSGKIRVEYDWKKIDLTPQRGSKAFAGHVIEIEKLEDYLLVHIKLMDMHYYTVEVAANYKDRYPTETYGICFGANKVIKAYCSSLVIVSSLVEVGLIETLPKHDPFGLLKR